MGLKKGTSSWPPNVAASKCNQDNLGTTLPMGSDHEPDLRAEGPRAGAREPCSVWGDYPRPGTDDTHRHEPKTPEGSQVLWAPSWALGLSLHPHPCLQACPPQRSAVTWRPTSHPPLFRAPPAQAWPPALQHQGPISPGLPLTLNRSTVRSKLSF